MHTVGILVLVEWWSRDPCALQKFLQRCVLVSTWVPRSEFWIQNRERWHKNTQQCQNGQKSSRSDRMESVGKMQVCVVKSCKPSANDWVSWTDTFHTFLVVDRPVLTYSIFTHNVPYKTLEMRIHVRPLTLESASGWILSRDSIAYDWIKSDLWYTNQPIRWLYKIVFAKKARKPHFLLLNLRLWRCTMWLEDHRAVQNVNFVLTWLSCRHAEFLIQWNFLIFNLKDLIGREISPRGCNGYTWCCETHWQSRVFPLTSWRWRTLPVALDNGWRRPHRLKTPDWNNTPTLWKHNARTAINITDNMLLPNFSPSRGRNHHPSGRTIQEISHGFERRAIFCVIVRTWYLRRHNNLRLNKFEVCYRKNCP